MKNRIIIIIIAFLFMLISFKLFNENAKIYIDKIDEINYKDNIKNNILKNYYESTFTTLIPKSNFESLFNELQQFDTDYEVYYSQIDVISQVESETTKINPNNILIYESYLSKYNFFEIVEGDMFDDIEYDISCDIPILASDNSGLIVGEEVKLRAVTKESYRENYLSDMYLKGKVVGLIKYYDESVSVIVPDLKNNLSQLGLDEFYTEVSNKIRLFKEEISKKHLNLDSLNLFDYRYDKVSNSVVVSVKPIYVASLTAAATVMVKDETWKKKVNFDKTVGMFLKFKS